MCLFAHKKPPFRFCLKQVERQARACFKIAFWHLCVTVCGRFVPDEGRVAGYVT
ncbi:DUF6783 domain-containing protein [Robinsoniella peoriensis]|uniref:DUF6783 domain-containing protein n=1 Tax=Robinsoniella peoriensis TaxID=180332 RepID=UPI002FE5013A